jgi:hypothetical protein
MACRKLNIVVTIPSVALPGKRAAFPVLSYNARFSRRQKGYECAPCLKKHYEVPFVQGIRTIE